MCNMAVRPGEWSQHPLGDGVVGMSLWYHEVEVEGNVEVEGIGWDRNETVREGEGEGEGEEVELRV